MWKIDTLYTPRTVVSFDWMQILEVFEDFVWPAFNEPNWVNDTDSPFKSKIAELQQVYNIVGLDLPWFDRWLEKFYTKRKGFPQRVKFISFFCFWRVHWNSRSGVFIFAGGLYLKFIQLPNTPKSKHSMDGIFTYIWLIFMVNVGKIR